MNEFAERIERDFPVRRKEKEKVDFRTWLVYTLKELGYSPKLESGTSALSAGGNVTNVVVGDIEKAKIVLAAHYDSGVREVLPPLICPTRPATYMLYEALIPLLALAVSFLISFGVTFALNMPNMTLPLFLLLLVVGLFYPKYGKSETNNKNANTSGVVALLEVAKALTPRYRGEVCFLFLDGGTQGGKGAKRLIHAHPELKKKSVVVLDCVGEGDELLIRRRLEHGVETVACRLPLVMTVNGTAPECRPRHAKLVMKYKHAITPSECQLDQVGCYAQLRESRPYLNITEWGVADVDADDTQLGLSGSPTKVKKIENVVFQAKESKRLTAADADIESLMVELIASHTLG